jgi:FkbM family methyltransferase
MIHNFNKSGAEYTFDSLNNTNISNFDWFMGSLNGGNWEPETFNTFHSVQDKNKSALDIGGWIGPTAIWLSQHFKSVVVVEADNIALCALKKNLETSNCNNVTIIDKPIYSESGLNLWFGVNGFRSGGLGESTSQLRVEKKNNDAALTTISLSDILDEMGRENLGFIKVDIEGGEEHIIPQLFTEASKIECPIWLSFHVSWWNDMNVERYLDYFKMSTVDTDILINTLKNTPICDILFEFKNHE